MADYYQAENANPAAVTPEQEVPTNAPEKPEQASALLPKSLLGEVKPGDTVTLKVVHVYEDEIEVAKSEGTKSESKAEDDFDLMAAKYRKD